MIATDAVFGNATPLMEPTRATRRQRFWCRCSRSSVLPVVTGFNGSTLDGRPTTLGRGGSDFSASILAAALDAAELWIWTDVDGIMTGDPRLVPDARVLDRVTYSEAAELAYNGAKVLHPRTLAPLVERQIPVWSKNSFAPEKPGTRIVPHDRQRRSGPHAVTSMADVALVSIEPANSALSGTKVMARALDALARANVEVLAITSSSYRQSFCFLVRQSELERATEYLEEDLSLEFAHGYLKPIASGCECRADRRGGRGHARHARSGGPHLHRDFPAPDQHHRHRAGIERTDHRDRGASRRAWSRRCGRFTRSADWANRAEAVGFTVHFAVCSSAYSG